MLIKKGNNWVIGDEYEIQGEDRFSFFYIKGKKRVLVYFEDLDPPFRRYINSSMLKDWIEPKDMFITPIEKEEIKRNTKEGWEFLGVPIVFDD